MFPLEAIIQTQTMGFAEYWIIFIFFICLSIVFLLVKSGHKNEIVLLHMLIMSISLLIAGIAMLSYDLLFTLCFILFQVLSWIINLMMVKL